MNESQAFNELTSYIEKSVASGTLLFKLSDIRILYETCLEEFMPPFFALDHVNCSWWMPVHIRDMTCCLTISRMSLRTVLCVLSKTTNKFSAIPFDEENEQKKKIVNSSGDVIGLTENPDASQRWMLSGPEMATGHTSEAV